MRGVAPNEATPQLLVTLLSARREGCALRSAPAWGAREKARGFPWVARSGITKEFAHAFDQPIVAFVGLTNTAPESVRLTTVLLGSSWTIRKYDPGVAGSISGRVIFIDLPGLMFTGLERLPTDVA